MTVYEMIQELSQYGPEQEVVFDAYIPNHNVSIDLGDRKVCGDVNIDTEIDLSMRYVDEVREMKSRGDKDVAVHIAITQ